MTRTVLSEAPRIAVLQVGRLDALKLARNGLSGSISNLFGVSAGAWHINELLIVDEVYYYQ